jgi:hypothetical protein
MPQDNSANSKKTLQEIHEIHEFEEHRERRWPVTLAYLWAAFLVALVVVFGGRWIYRTVNDSSNNKSSAEISKQNGQKESGNKTAQGAVIVPASPAKGSVSAPKSSTKATKTPTPASIPNTGDDADSAPPTPASLPNTGG